MKLKNWFLFIIVAIFVGSTVVACSSSNDEINKEEEGGNGTVDEESQVTISLGLSVYGELPTRGGRPLYSSESLQAVTDVVVCYFRQQDGAYVYAGTSTIENFSEAASSGATKTLKINENLENGSYRFLVLGFEAGYSSTFKLPALQEGTTTLDEMVLTLQDGTTADEFFIGLTAGVNLAAGKTAYVNLTLRRAVAAVFGYFKNIPVQVNGTAVKSLSVKTVTRTTGLQLMDITPAGTSAAGANLWVLDLSATANNGLVYTCDAVTSGTPAKEANSWIVGGYTFPIAAVEGEATLVLSLCSDSRGEVPVKSWLVKCLDAKTNLFPDAQKDFSLDANMFYGMGVKSKDGELLETDAAVDLSTALQIVINKKIYKLDVLAFPTAVGFAAPVTTGARGAENMEVYRVTNLDASGEGSFADAISKEGRFVVFDVAGVIDMGGRQLVLKPNQTVLFQTAPGDGIELYNTYVSASGASNLIVRYMRVRTGRQVSGSDNRDACGVANGQNMIFDHCSFTWGLDEVFSINPDNKGSRPCNITLQNSIVGQGCMNHSAGGLIQTNEDEGITIFRNLLIDNKTRNFKIKGLNQYVNNVVYNWGTGAGYNMGGESAGGSLTTIENNYFIKGPCWVWTNTGVADVAPDIIGTDKCVPADNSGKYYEVLSQQNPARPFTGGNADFKTYCVGNYYDHDKDGTLNGVEITQGNWDTYCSGSPAFLGNRPSEFTDIRLKTTAAEAYEWVVEHVGATLPARDKVDAFMIEELTSLGLKGTIFRNQRQELEYPLANTWQNINTASDNPQDSDGDGIPDYFEEAHGLNKNDPADAVAIAGNGYTHLENYVFIEIEGLTMEY